MDSNEIPDQRVDRSVRRELQRKSIHLSMIIIPVWLFLTPYTLGLFGLIIATFATVVIDLLRLNDRRLSGFFMRLGKSLIRRHEEEHLLGSTYFMIAALLSVLAFEEPIAICALTFLVIGDAAAAIIGKRFGRPIYWGKSLHGSFACFMVCFGLGALLLDEMVVVAAGALAATAAEALPVPMDDNMRVPIFSGLVMQLVTQYLQG